MCNKMLLIFPISKIEDGIKKPAECSPEMGGVCLCHKGEESSMGVNPTVAYAGGSDDR